MDFGIASVSLAGRCSAERGNEPCGNGLVKHWLTSAGG